jgi:hypothetical protein
MQDHAARQGLEMQVVGRIAEMAAIERALDEVGRGCGAMVICGDPGIGKTTVWRHGMAAAQARGYQLTRCRPAESERCLSFSGLADLMENMPEDLLDALPELQRDALDAALLKRVSPRTGAYRRAILTGVTTRNSPGQPLPAGLFVEGLDKVHDADEPRLRQAPRYRRGPLASAIVVALADLHDYSVGVD